MPSIKPPSSLGDLYILDGSQRVRQRPAPCNQFAFMLVDRRGYLSVGKAKIKLLLPLRLRSLYQLSTGEYLELTLLAVCRSYFKDDTVAPK